MKRQAFVIWFFYECISSYKVRIIKMFTGKNKNFTVLEEVNASDLSKKYRSHQVFPYDKRYARGDQTDDQYSLNVLNLEGEILHV